MPETLVKEMPSAPVTAIPSAPVTAMPALAGPTLSRRIRERAKNRLNTSINFLVMAQENQRPLPYERLISYRTYLKGEVEQFKEKRYGAYIR
jgi:hypothetical protein